VWYLFYVQRKIDRQSAIVYLVKNIVSRNIQRTGLEEELKQIALQRDQIAPDRFDSLVKDCPILDIDHSINAQQLFEFAADELAPRLNMTAGEIYNLLIEREKESNTIVRPGLAIPHIIVEGEHVFQVLLVRCKEGVVFSQLQEPVKTAFILIGSADERNYHLRALMTVAHIVSEEGFEDRWFPRQKPRTTPRHRPPVRKNPLTVILQRLRSRYLR
jgi:mannitol/fructose-specific phosphotransferase system IIA component (Ntr-type)